MSLYINISWLPTFSLSVPLSLHSHIHVQAHMPTHEWLTCLKKSNKMQSYYHPLRISLFSDPYISSITELEWVRSASHRQGALRSWDPAWLSVSAWVWSFTTHSAGDYVMFIIIMALNPSLRSVIFFFCFSHLKCHRTWVITRARTAVLRSCPHLIRTHPSSTV